MDSICAADVSGHRVGSFYVSSIYSLLYIPINKNASTWAISYFKNSLKWNLQFDDAMRIYDHNLWNVSSTIAHYRKIVILRDPIDRWISGIIQYVFSYFPDTLDINNDDLINYFFAKIYLDPHTLPQVNFLHNLDIKSIDFFMVNEKLEHNLDIYLSKKIPSEYVSIPKNLYKNSTLTDKTDVDILLHNKLRNIIDNDSNYRSKIMSFYKSDYDLIENVTFYAAN